MPTGHTATAHGVAVGERAERQVTSYPPLMLYGVLSAALGFALQTCAGLWAFVSSFTDAGSARHSDIALMSYSAIPIIVGVFLVAAELVFQLPKKRAHRRVLADTIQNRELTVILTAYNDELSIGPAVADFLGHPLVRRVLVVDNNSSDRTTEVAGKAGAIVIREETPGYGSCVYRGFEEALKYSDTELILLCEGDMTFRAFDIEKFLAYIPHASIVNGTRIVEQLRDRETQLSTFIYYGNFAVGKLLELKHIGRGTFTDVGTTYKLCRAEPLARLLPHLDRRVNLEFNAHFLDTALEAGIDIVECPITFFARVGKSKGGNVNNTRALKVGLRMIAGILMSWRLLVR
ncbi:MAG: glycosyltransferase family 2 protein [Candidatus Solibacter sp.]|nr:glycosyltransferase family 2 protein [Candidatus Solibacter sp.]